MNSLGIVAAHLIGTPPESAEVTKDLYKTVPLTRLLYLTPEAFKKEDTKRVLMNINKVGNIARFIIDEAHCVSLWGTDFRKSYLSIRPIIRMLFQNIPIMLLTASATPQVRKHILNIVGVANDEKLKYFLFSYDRPNLQYEAKCVNPDERFDEVLNICQSDQFMNKSGIIYCASKNECNNMVKFLRDNGIKASAYHAGLKDDVRLSVQTQWSHGDDDCKIIVATIAFGI